MNKSPDDNKIVQLFPHKGQQKLVNPDDLSKGDIKAFLETLDASLESFHLLNAAQKFSLYQTLVEFTHVSLGLINLKKEK